MQCDTTSYFEYLRTTVRCIAAHKYSKHDLVKVTQNYNYTRAGLRAGTSEASVQIDSRDRILCIVASPLVAPA